MDIDHSISFKYYREFEFNMSESSIYLGKIIDHMISGFICLRVIDPRKIAKVRPQKPPLQTEDPPPKPRYKWSHLQISIGADFYKRVRPRFGGSKTDRI